MQTFQLAVIPGDGIGPEVTSEALKVLDEKHGPAYDAQFTAFVEQARRRHPVEHVSELTDRGFGARVQREVELGRKTRREPLSSCGFVAACG